MRRHGSVLKSSSAASSADSALEKSSLSATPTRKRQKMNKYVFSCCCWLEVLHRGKVGCPAPGARLPALPSTQVYGFNVQVAPPAAPGPFF